MNFGEGFGFSACACRDSIGDLRHASHSQAVHPLMQQWTGGMQLCDLNSDSRITPADAAIALRLAATGAYDPAADVSGDDRVTSPGALMILQAAAGRIEL